VVDIAPVRYAGLSSFADYVRGMRALDLDALDGRATADRELTASVPDPVVRSFLLQNLRREGSGWRWQMNLQLLGDRLDDLADWPDLHAEPYPGPTLWLAGAESGYVTAENAPAMRALFPRVQLVTVKKAGHWVHAEQPEVFVSALRKFMQR
jgi:esterase